MRALIVEPGPSFSVQDVYNGWVKGLNQCGLTVAKFNLGDRISFFGGAHVRTEDGEWRQAFKGSDALRLAANGITNALYRVWPHLVIIVSGFFMPPDLFEVIRARGHKIVLIHTESPYEDDVQLQRARFADLNVLNDPTNIERFRAVAPTVYLPHAYDPELHSPYGPAEQSDFFFAGTGYRSRIDFFEAVNWTDIDVKLGGNWQQTDPDSPLRPLIVNNLEHCLPNEETVQFYRGAKASANLYRREANQSHLEAGWAMGPREVELAATGTFFLRDSRGEGDELLPMLPIIETPAEFGEQLRWWLAHDTQRETAASKAREALAGRTFAANAAELLTLL